MIWGNTGRTSPAIYLRVGLRIKSSGPTLNPVIHFVSFAFALDNELITALLATESKQFPQHLTPPLEIQFEGELSLSQVAAILYCSLSAISGQIQILTFVGVSHTVAPVKRTPSQRASYDHDNVQVQSSTWMDDHRS